MRKLAILFIVAMTFTLGSVGASYATPPDLCFYDDYEFLNPQPMPPG